MPAYFVEYTVNGVDYEDTVLAANRDEVVEKIKENCEPDTPPVITGITELQEENN